MRTAYSAEHYRKQLGTSATRPIWQYHHSPFVKSARPDHLALDGKAFRYDDPFWDTHYPPNGWGCKCYVTTMSEGQAQRQGVDVGQSENENIPPIDPTWSYNVGQSALAPNFDKYTQLPQKVLDTLKAQYRKDIDKVKLSSDDLKTIRDDLAERFPTPDTEGAPKLDDDIPPETPQLYVIGNLDEKRQNKMKIDDSKIVITGYRIYHCFSEKDPKIEIKPEHFADFYNLIQEPDLIYENLKPDHPELGKEYHFVKRPNGRNQKPKDKIYLVVLRKQTGTSMQIITMSEAGDVHNDRKRYDMLYHRGMK
jgi:hypothetical protein